MYFSRVYYYCLNVFHNNANDVARVLILSLLVYFSLGQDITAIELLKYALGMTVAFALFSHVQRRVFFPYLNMKTLMHKAMNENSIASAIVFFSVSLIICTLLWVSSGFFRH